MTRKLNYEAGNFAGRQLEFRCQIVSNHHHLKKGLYPCTLGKKDMKLFKNIIMLFKMTFNVNFKYEGQAKGLPLAFLKYVFLVFELNSISDTLCSNGAI